jgi:hypothetical protein
MGVTFATAALGEDDAEGSADAEALVAGAGLPAGLGATASVLAVGALVGEQAASRAMVMSAASSGPVSLTRRSMRLDIIWLPRESALVEVRDLPLCAGRTLMAIEVPVGVPTGAVP